MIEIGISAEFKAKCGKAALGCVEAVVATGATPPGLDEALRSCEGKIAKLPEPRAVLESSAILATRAGYKALGKDPARYRGSAEALLRRLIAGKGMPRIHNVVDVINLVSVESRLPIGLYDLAQLEGAIEFRAGRPRETYIAIGKHDLYIEAHGSPKSDCERTMVTDATTRVLAIIISFSGASALDSPMKRMKEMLETFCGAKEVDFKIVS
jgi:DNA/RNA-binding domain of Phe-tRNA-synthetase-like protein